MLTMHSFIHCVGSCPGEWVEESCASKRGTFRWWKWARNSWHCLPNFVSRWFDAKPLNIRSDHRVKSEYAFKLMQSYDNSSFTCRVFVLFSPGDERFLLIFFTFRATSWTMNLFPCRRVGARPIRERKIVLQIPLMKNSWPPTPLSPALAYNH